MQIKVQQGQEKQQQNISLVGASVFHSFFGHAVGRAFGFFLESSFGIFDCLESLIPNNQRFQKKIPKEEEIAEAPKKRRTNCAFGDSVTHSVAQARSFWNRRFQTSKIPKEAPSLESSIPKEEANLQIFIF
uniref:Uncharacterized protein n=1 Tax=Pediastrum angulosum TaxID=271408 RepID=A0A2U8GHK0_9CHLO|nr:hypothetical protein [Pediastrum angulosum]AWI68162.1 hypothetical protein [Pediastrum angulosum]